MRTSQPPKRHVSNFGALQVTKDEWLTSTNSEEMVEACRASTTKRKLRLFAAACFRRLEHFLPDERQSAAISALADCTHEIPRGVASGCRQALPDSRDSFDGKYAGKDDPYFVALMLYRELVSSATGRHAAFAARGLANCTAERVEQCNLLRCVVGTSPFEEKVIPLEWRSGDVVKLAKTIYDMKSYDLLPKLASELEQSGCDDVEMLTHCRSSGVHVHGCWVVDTLLCVQ